MLQYKSEFKKFYALLNEKNWVIHIKETFRGVAYVIIYLGRYTHNIAIFHFCIKKKHSSSRFF